MASLSMLGIRVEKENLPVPSMSNRLQQANTINFAWGDKIDPRVGAAWGSLPTAR